MNNKIKIALALISGGTLLYLGRKIKNRENKPKNFTAPDGNTYHENEMYFTSDGKIYKNGKLLHFKTPEPNAVITPKMNFKYEAPSKNHDAQTKHVEYHHKGIRHH